MTIDDDFLTALRPFDPSWRGLLPTSRAALAYWVEIDDDNAALVDDGDDVRLWPQTVNAYHEIGDLLKLLAHRIEREDDRAHDKLSTLPRSTQREVETAERHHSEQSDRRAKWFAMLHATFSLTTSDGKALRDDILIAVEAGDMRPADAERAAELLGWSRFADWADRTRIDPMTLDKWTLPMVAAWIHWHNTNVHDKDDLTGQRSERVSERHELENFSQDEIERLGLTTQFHEWRRACGVEIAHDIGAIKKDIGAIKKAAREANLEHVIDKVRRHWPEYIAASTRWIECGNGYVLGKRENHGWSDLPDETSDTKNILYDALLSKQFNAERYCDGGFKPIPSDEWSALKIVGFDDEGGVFRVFAPDQSEYLAVRVPRAEVQPPNWIALLKSLIELDYGQEQAVDEIREHCAKIGTKAPSQLEIRDKYKQFSGIVGSGKRGPRGCGNKAN
jgi:hypothetical protein